MARGAIAKRVTLGGIAATCAVLALALVPVGAAPSLVVAGTTPTSGSGALPANSYPIALAQVGSYAYVATSSSNPPELDVVDVSDPTNPHVVGSTSGCQTATPLDAGADSYGVAAAGSYAYVADYGTNDVAVVNVSNPACPTRVGVATLSGSAGPWGIAVQGDYVYVANSNVGTVSVVNVSNPASPVVAGTTPAAGSAGGLPANEEPAGIAVQGSYAYVPDYGNHQVSVVDVSNPASPQVVGSTPQAGTAGGLPCITSAGQSYCSSPYDMVVSGTHAYVGNFESDVNFGSFTTIDVSDPTHPVAVATSPAAGTTGGLPSGMDAYYMVIDGTTMFATLEGGVDEVAAVDISNPLALTVEATTPAPGSTGGLPLNAGVEMLAVGNNTLTVLGGNIPSLSAFDVSAYAPPTTTPPTTNPSPPTTSPNGTSHTVLANTGASIGRALWIGVASAICGGVLARSARRRRRASRSHLVE